jgi:hypothetical protein
MTKQTASPELNDNALAVRVIQAITGCGTPEALARVSTIDVAKLVQLERASKRSEIVLMLYGAPASPAKPDQNP